MTEPGDTEISADVETRVGALRIRIDRLLCVGFGDCVEAAPLAFALDEEGLAVFTQPDAEPRGALLRACEVCPVDALTAWNADGEQLVP